MNFTLPATSIRVITIVVVAIALGAIGCLATLATCLLLGIHPLESLVTAFVGLTGQLVGSLTGLLVNTRTQPSSPDERGDMPQTNRPPL